MEIALSLVFMIGSGYWLQQGIFVYGFYVDGKPGSGFIPVLFSLLVLGLSAILLGTLLWSRYKSKKDGATAPLEEAKTPQGSVRSEILLPFIPVAIAIGGIFAITYLGIVIGVTLLTFCWVRFISRYSLKRSLLFTVPIVLFIYVVFVWWLRVPFPRGIFGF